MRRSHALALSVLTGIALSTTVSGAPAAAQLIDRFEFHEVDAETIDDFCGVPGFTVDTVFTADGTETVRSQGREGLIHFMVHASITFTMTNPDTDLSVVERTRVVDKDLHVTDNGDGTLTIIILNTGASSLYGPDGKAIARNPGQVRFELVVDHGGTPTDPSDDTEVSFTQIKGSTGRTDDFCEAVLGAIG